MPWKNITPMEKINRFVVLALGDHFTITELCEQFGIAARPATNIWIVTPPTA